MQQVTVEATPVGDPGTVCIEDALLDLDSGLALTCGRHGELHRTGAQLAIGAEDGVVATEDRVKGLVVRLYLGVVVPVVIGAVVVNGLEVQQITLTGGQHSEREGARCDRP